MPATRRAICAALIAACGAGCEVGPTYHAPQTAVPATFTGDATLAGSTSTSEATHPDLQHWWTVFHDPVLERLIEQALRNNRDLKMAISRVREARAQREVVAGALLPEVDATAGYNRSRGSKNVKIPFSALAGGSSGAGATSGPGGRTAASGNAFHTEQIGGAGTGASASPPAGGAPPGGPNSPFGEGGLPGVTTNLFQAGFDATWEADVFGGTRRAMEAADAQAAAAQEGARGVRITLLAEVASTYLQLRADQARESVIRQNTAAQRTTWKLLKDKFDAGVGDDVQLEQQAAQLQLTEATLPPLLAAERSAEHTLAFLLGEEPGALLAELSAYIPLPRLPSDVPLGVPSELLRRRPDIRQAERNLAAANAEVGVATAQLFPQFSLTGSLGLDSSDLKHLPEWSSHYYSIAPGVSWPILDWTRLHAAIRVQNEEEEQALLAYETAVAQSLKDVEDALVQYRAEREHHAELARAVAAARRAHQVANQIYLQGLADQLATLQAEQAVLQAEDMLVQSEASLRVDLVALYKALGGGWDVNS